MPDQADSRLPDNGLSPTVYVALDRLKKDAEAATKELRVNRHLMPSDIAARLFALHCGIATEITNLRNIVNASAQAGNAPMRPATVRMEDLEIHPANYQRLEESLHRAGDSLSLGLGEDAA